MARGRFWPETHAGERLHHRRPGSLPPRGGDLHCDRVAADRIGLVGLGGAQAAFSLWTVGR